jgi:CheY-like chemotaxis protein
MSLYANEATEVKVTLPLLRDMPRSAATSLGTPKSVASISRDSDESIEKLRTLLVGQKVALCGFEMTSPDPIIKRMGELLKESITKFLTQWYGLKVVPLGQKAGVIIANEAEPAVIARLIHQGTANRKVPTILVLCSHSSRFDRSHSDVDTKVGFIAKPVGPLKLARALLQCLEGAPPLTTPSYVEPSSAGPESNDLSKIFEELSLSPHGGEVLDNSRMAADNDNARKAIESPTPSAVTEKTQEFPFPVERPSLPKPHSMPADKESLVAAGKPVGRFRSASIILSEIEKSSSNIPAATSKSAAKSISHELIQPSIPKADSPSLLLVDDNKINLSLLRTYMRKRKYDVVDEAENGLEAVNKFEGREGGYDIIFMDISMPVLDGFGATRQIRAIEERRRKKVAEMSKAPEGAKTGERTPALVIALTGLASSRDQSEAFSSGIDLFLTKPVAFKEVGKMLDNWEANREKDSRLEAILFTPPT